MRFKLFLSIVCISSLAMAEQIIRVSQIGYLPEAKKFAIIMTGDSGRWEYTRYIFAKTKSALFTKRKVQQNFKSSKLLSRKFAAFFNV